MSAPNYSSYAVVTATGTVQTRSITVPSASNQILLVSFLTNDSGRPASITSVTYNGVAMTLADASVVDGYAAAVTYYLVNPASGTHDVVWTNASVWTAGIYCEAVFPDVDQAAPILQVAEVAGAWIDAVGESTISFSSVANAVAYSAAAITYTGTVSVAGTATKLGSGVYDGVITGAFGHSAASASSFAWTGWGADEYRYAAHAINLKAAGASDTTAPTLSSSSVTSVGTTTATGNVTTDEGNGTLYGIVSTSATAPSAAQIQAGQTNTGAAAVWSGNQAVTSTGAKTFSITGMAAGTSYYAHFQHKDAANNNSAVVTSAQFTTGSSGTASGATLTGTSSLTAGSATGASTGSFTTAAMENNSGAGLLASVAVSWTWYQGAIGSAPTSTTHGSGTTNSSGILTAAGLPLAAGFLLVRTADSSGVYYQAGTPA